MSGPVDDQDGLSRGMRALGIEVREGRAAEVGGMGIRRVLPTKGRRTVGPWCFVDLMSPDDVANPDPMEVGPHPHIGLSTVTWLFEGEALHTDSLGSEQVIRPGELNLMTAGHGIAHAELEVRPGSSAARGEFVKGAQMWLAQTESTRHGSSSFAHHKDLPRAEIAGGEVQVLAGSLAGAESPVETDWPLVGAELRQSGPVELPVDPQFEHAVVPIDRRVKVDEVIVEPGSLALIPPGFESVRIEVDGASGRSMLLGGVPFPIRIQMWWNFVARTRDELTQAWRDWEQHNDDRFAPVPSSLDRIAAPRPLWMREA
ncbi:MAG: pirin family protein [Acidimicrobiia bacterium]|nr:pirin family protein [Acidimicrobiia bacterium]MBT8218144.1 pirin family protein [Acidimicrobiia bacterium]NNF08976.1 pirin family protein [Acidimicrobiia bacterium]NNL68626.1 pirin family protein [Acidimicrobiia bacterium]